jgi:hypothetical protein
MMHTLSAPDLYRYQNQQIIPVGEWDLMASTNYNCPQGLGAYMKYTYAGWIDSMPEITAPGTYTLYPANGTSPEKTLYKIHPDRFSSNYFVLEYRKTSSNIFENSLPGSGLLIYRINIDSEGKGNSGYDDKYIFDEVYLFRPNGTTTENGILSQAHFAKEQNRTTFNVMTNPYPFNHYNEVMGGLFITDITEAGDSIQFTIREPIDTLTVNTNDIVFDCDEGSRQFIISANTAWSLYTGITWLSISTKKGKGNDTITFVVPKNTQPSTRTTTVRITPLLGKFSTEITVQQTTCNNIEQINHKPTLNIFPNPAEKQLTISHPNLNEITNVAAYSITGQHIPLSVLERKENDMVIDISKLSPGIYYIKLSSEKQATVKSFVVK